MKHNQILIMCVALAALYGCSSNCKDRGECECISRYDCSETEICVSGECVDNTQELWIVPERKFGETCISHRECIDGICLPVGPDNGGVCTTSCMGHEDCADGWQCREWTGSDYFESLHVCVQNTASKLCMTCAVDGHCNAVGDLCIELEEGRVCAQDCSIDTCPVGYTCEAYVRNGATYAQCLPLDGTCECGAGKEGMGRACTNDNEYGVCAGWSYCQQKNGEYAWSECDAKVPEKESCNGIDDDCDGLIDGFDPGLTYDELGEEGSLYPICYLGGCVGRWQCREGDAGQYSWVCDAGDPEKEICNGVDDNCNSVVDEIFVNADGLYVNADHCGSCGASCSVILSDLLHDPDGNVVPGAVDCEVRDGAAVCVPKQCADGYYPYPHEAPVSCIKLESPSCQVCGADSDCHVYSDRCMELDGDFGTHCLQSCDELSPYSGCTGSVGVQSCCPDGFLCQIMDGEKLCVPKGESCSCDAPKVGMVRNCVVSSGTDVCQGRQTCEKLEENVYAWSDCSAESLTVEVCDGQDNNCDGQVDEDFRDAQGRYNADEHCGKCNEDCPSHWKAPELHASGACLLENDDYVCKFTGCKLEQVLLGKICRDDKDCPKGNKCDRQVYYCVPESGEPSQVSCSADDDCKSLSSSHRCVDGVCSVKVQYHDVNGIAADGCECGQAVDGGADSPEIFSSWPDENSTYADRDCDGIDGAIVSSLFVSAHSKSSKGTMDAPYQTIGEAIAAFDPAKHTAILVAAGTYLEQVVLKNGAKVYGGYSSDFRTRNIILNPTMISAPPPSDDTKPGSVYVPAGSRKTILSGFTINGYDVSESMAKTGDHGRNSYAVYIESATSNLILANNAIVAGHAGDGGRGASGDSGYAGASGENGQNSRECSDTMCNGQVTKGGAGGKNSYCNSANGRQGATAKGGQVTQDFMNSAWDGDGGANNSYTHAHPEHYAYCKYDCTSGGYANGDDGRNGTNGTHGMGGMGCTVPFGQISGKNWVGSSGGAGTMGGAALGGGGGGAGGSAVNKNDSTCTEGNLLGDIGGSGGGGGAGGCGGAGGGAGGAGGGAFGVWIASAESMPNIYANQIRLGIGGKGGEGGAGGAGGKGGKGGIGGRSIAPA
ncbi:MAG: hypothetical protein IJM59_04150, partial [Proteobacteria bacterium]|nr:hypothetical protein [Pseudomonadota bacterium]